VKSVLNDFTGFDYKLFSSLKKLNSNGSNEIKKLCVDPQITSFDILKSLIAQAFSLKGYISAFNRNSES
jgi:hypothetical protein